MSPTSRFKALFAFLVISAAALAAATPASAQLRGSAKGRVYDERGRAVNDATVTLTYVGDPTVRPISILTGPDQSLGSTVGTTTTSGGGDGWWQNDSLIPGDYTIVAHKGTLVGTTKDKKPFHVYPGDMATADPVYLAIDMTGSGGVATAAEAPKNDKGMNNAEIEKYNANQKELKDAFDAAKLSLTAGNFDEALAKVSKLSPEMTDHCGACQATLGDIYLKKGDVPTAEADFKKAIAIDPTLPGPYAHLAEIYNSEKQFDEAAKMSSKANELLGASATGGDATSTYNQGVILWNAGKAAEAQTYFEKATQLDPKMSEAFFQLGMACVNQNKMPEAKKAFDQYLKLDPKGKNADMAKAILSTIK